MEPLAVLTDMTTLQKKAITLYRVIEKKTRNLEKDRIRLGKLFLRIRQAFINEQGGTALKRGRNGGMFTTWLEDSGINVGTAYAYMNLAETGKWKSSETPSRKRIVYWQKFAQRMKKATTNAAKVKLLRLAVAHLTTLYDIRVQSVTIR